MEKRKRKEKEFKKMSVGHIQAKKKVQWKGGWWGSLFEMRGVAVENVPVVTLSHCNVRTLAEMKYSLLPTPRRHWWAAPTPPLLRGSLHPISILGLTKTK